ncbi:MAG: carboxypeptidase-like regulatory domain-containing protein, partial [Tenacibaculum sp.]
KKIKLKFVTLKQIFFELSKQSNFNFTFGSYVLNSKKTYSIYYHKKTLENVLADLSEKFSFDYIIQGSNIAIKPKPTKRYTYKQIEAQQITVSGAVSDKTGMPLPGASIVEKGTNNGVTTNLDGKYNISVSSLKATLVFSYLGYTSKEVLVGKQNTIAVQLQPSSQKLNEVVVVGYGTVKKKELTGAHAVITSNNLATSSFTSVGAALQGKASGISILSSSGFPGSDTSIRIRGVNTFSGNSSPLLIVDGIPINGGLESLNPNDIQSVSILKDASSAAIYGSRAANGVVLIKTKKGTTQRARFSINMSSGIQQPNNIIEVLTAEEFVSVIKEMRDNKAAIDGGNPTTRFDDVSPQFFGSGTKWSNYIYKAAPTYNK